MKRTASTISATLAVFISIASLLYAQESANPSAPPNPPNPAARAQHRVKFLTNKLSLTAQQQQQALTIFTNASSSEQTMHGSMKTAHQNLQNAIKSNDTAGIEQASNTIGNLMAQTTAAHAKAQAAFYQILTPDQQSKLSEMEKDGPRGFFHGHRPGHFGGE
ncbi:MAG TPA: Spy/CpxP family protein refolding chaperone [Candidatus Angelobacter sp.]|nr:Spy/CpxP family protein refolding chaperone [Candidatus Angelobacter sp.]